MVETLRVEALPVEALPEDFLTSLECSTCGADDGSSTPEMRTIDRLMASTSGDHTRAMILTVDR